MSKTLKPCPKGHPAERHRTPSGTAVIACHKCGLRLTGIQKEITAFWNHRPGEEAARRDSLKYTGDVLKILKTLIGRAQPEEGQAWEILISEPEYDAFKDLVETIDKLLETKP